MSLAKRIIPTILSRGGQLVKGRGFSADRVVGQALQAALIHASRGVDELCILDVTATKEGREPDYELVKRLTDKCFAPVTYGGGVFHVEHVRKLLNAGADKVCMNSCGLHAMSEMSKIYGSQAIVYSLDYDESSDQSRIIISDIAKLAQDSGIGEILLQYVDRDGTREGYDIDTIKEVCDAVDIPVIASGGCSGPEDMYNAIQAGASACAAGALFLFTEHTPRSCARYLHNKGIEVRI